MNSRFDNNEALVELGADSSRREARGGLPQKYAEDKQSHTCSVIAVGDQPRPTIRPLQKKGPSYCQGPNKLTQCDSSGPNSVAGLTPADGIILADAHPGNTVNATESY